MCLECMRTGQSRREVDLKAGGETTFWSSPLAVTGP